MWYVIGEFIPGRIAWWGAYEKEEDADTIAKQVNGVAIMVKDWPRFAELDEAGRTNEAD